MNMISNFLYLSIACFVMISCNSKNNADVISSIENVKTENKLIQMTNNQTRFLLVSNELAYGMSLFKTRTTKNYYDSSEFLAKLWSLFGKPSAIIFEGYNYTIKDTKTNVVFIAFCSGVGTAYGSMQNDFDKLEPILNDFELLLDKTPLADCEIEIENDFGKFKHGAKDGKPFIEQ